MYLVFQRDHEGRAQVTAPKRASFECEGDPCYAVESEPHNFELEDAYTVCYAVINIMMNCPSIGQDLWNRMFNGSWDYGLVPYNIPDTSDAGYYVTGDNPPRARMGVNRNFSMWGDAYEMTIVMLQLETDKRFGSLSHWEVPSEEVQKASIR